MIVDSQYLKSSIIERLKTLPVCKPTSNMRNWTVRCPYCGDSKISNHGHFSILLDLNSDAPILYRCFKCNESGILTPQTLEDLDIGSTLELDKQLKLFNRTSGNGIYFKDKIKSFAVPVPFDCAENAQKLDYINHRLGTHLTYEDCAKYKIILSLVEFMRYNQIKISNANNGSSIDLPVRSVQELNRNYLGFLSSNNNKITFRDTTPDGTGFFGRYYKVTIDIFNQTPNTFYSLKNQFDPLYNESIEINIAEGTFDILSVYEKMGKPQSQNSLFFASCGYGFSTILKYLIYMGVTTDIVLNIYSDNDKSDRDHRKSLHKKNMDLWLDHVIIHRNGYSGEKDFGVPPDRIKEYQYELKI